MAAVLSDLCWQPWLSYLSDSLLSVVLPWRQCWLLWYWQGWGDGMAWSWPPSQGSVMLFLWRQAGCRKAGSGRRFWFLSCWYSRNTFISLAWRAISRSSWWTSSVCPYSIPKSVCSPFWRHWLSGLCSVECWATVSGVSMWYGAPFSVRLPLRSFCLTSVCSGPLR